MIHFKIESSNAEPGVETPWLPNTVEGHQAAAPAVSAMRSREGTMVAIAVRSDPVFSDEELLNLVALASKCWSHVAFMAGLTIGSPRLGDASGSGFVSPLSNPWIILKTQRGQNDSFSVFDAMSTSSLRTGAVLVGADRVVTFRIFRDRQLPHAIMAAAWRLANMGEWAKKFTSEVRLTGDTRLKWQTFNAISMHVNRGVEAPAARRGDDGQVVRRQTLEEMLRPPQDAETPSPARPRPTRSIGVQDLVDGNEYRVRLGRAGETGPRWSAWGRRAIHVQRNASGSVVSLTPAVEDGQAWAEYDPRHHFSPPSTREEARRSLTTYTPHGTFQAEDYYMQIEGVSALQTLLVPTPAAQAVSGPAAQSPAVPAVQTPVAANANEEAPE